MESNRIEIQGMSCQHCVARVRQALQDLDGVRVDEVEIGQAAVSFDPERVRLDEILAAIRSAGYSA